MRQIILILAFLALFASVQALSWTHIDVNTSQPTPSIVSGDNNFVTATYYSDGSVKAAMYNPISNAFTGEVSIGSVPGAPTEVRVLHIPGVGAYNKVWVMILVGTTLYSSECTVSGYTITSCAAFSQFYPWLGDPITAGHTVYDFEMTTVEFDGTPYAGVFFIMQDNVTSNYWLDFVDMDAQYDLDDTSPLGDWLGGCGGGGCGSRDNIDSDASTIQDDIATHKVFDSSGAGNGASRLAVAWRKGTTCYYDQHAFSGGWPALPNDSFSCADQSGNSLALVHAYFTDPYSSTEYNRDVVIYYNNVPSGMWKARLYADGSYIANSEVATNITSYMSGQACTIEEPTDQSQTYKQGVCVYATAANDVYQTAFRVSLYGVNFYNVANDLGVNLTDEAQEAYRPEAFWDEEEDKFGFLVEESSGPHVEYALLTPGVNITLPNNSDCRAMLIGSNHAFEGIAVNCATQGSFTNVQPATGSEFALKFYNNSTGSTIYAQYLIPSLPTVDFSSTTFATTSTPVNYKIEVANTPSNLPSANLGFPHVGGNWAWSQKTGPTYNINNADCTVDDPGGTGNSTTCTDGSNSWYMYIAGDGTTTIEGIQGSGGGDDPPPLPEIPMEAILLIVGVVLLVTFFLSRLGRRKSLK